MGKGKNILLLLLAAVVITACAALPGLVAVCQDGAAIGQTHYETVPNIQLHIRGEEAASPLKELARISLMDGGLEISDTMASMTAEEAEARFYDILQTYIDAGLVASFDAVVYESRCMLATVSSDASVNGVFWMATLISGDDQNFAQFDAAIDDETGHLLAVSYTGDRAFSAAEREKIREVFTDLYFCSLGLAAYAPFVTADLDGAYVGENTIAVRYRFGDAVYGELNVDFYVDEYGFYTQFPDMGVNAG